MDVMETIKEKLRKYPHVTLEEGAGSIRVLPPDETGFTVALCADAGAFTVSFDGWHEDFDNENDALNCFAFGLSDKARLKALSRGGTDYHWTLESRQGDAWVADSSVGLFLFPFWRKRSVRYLQNSVIAD